VIEADVGAAKRMVLHRRIAEALEGEPGQPRLFWPTIMVVAVIETRRCSTLSGPETVR